ncbi:MAG: Type II secretion system protein E, partial [Parcubacteria group bacterium GW2011_GWA2_40_8]
DSDTAKLAVHAALTGHIVLTTIHTNSATGIIPRLVDMGVEPFLIPSSVAVGMAQRLLQRLCNNCKRTFVPEPKVVAMLERELKSLPEKERERIPKDGYKLWVAPGCDKCAGQGKKGRIGIYEAFDMTSEMEKIIVTETTEGNILKEANRQGMVSMLQDGLLKALEGQVSLEEVLRVVEERETTESKIE